MQPNIFQIQTNYQTIEKQMFFFHSNKNDTHNRQQIKIYYAYQTIKQNFIYETKGQGS